MHTRLLVSLLALSALALAAFYVWPFFSVLSAHESASIILLGGGLLALAWLPLLYPIFRVIRAKPELPWKLRFVLVTCSLTLGAAVLLVLVVWTPIEMYLVYIAPQLQAIGERVGGPFVAAADFVIAYWWLGSPLALSAASVLLTNYLLPRWARVVHALRV
jgi:hypothetical protein